MNKAYLLCGRLSSGKTTYAKQLIRSEHAVLLSVDEIMLTLFGTDAGETHDALTAKLQAYLFEKAAEILDCGNAVVLDWGFWTRRSREEARQFFKGRHHDTEMIYLDPPEEVRQRWIGDRNDAIAAGRETGYPVDEGLADKMEALFEEPALSEVDRWVH